MDSMQTVDVLMVFNSSTSQGGATVPPRQSTPAALPDLGHRQDPHRLNITVLDYSSVVNLLICNPEVT